MFFFFQAEDGIRDDLVTGVQTCALPICSEEDRGVEDAPHELVLPVAQRLIDGQHVVEVRRPGEHTSERQSPDHLACRLRLEKKITCSRARKSCCASEPSTKTRS